MRQTNLQSFITIKTIPRASNARQAWDQWHHANPELGLFSALKEFSMEMRKIHKRKYSERQTLGLAFAKYATYEEFEVDYRGYTCSYRKILDEVRRRKGSGSL